MKKICGFLSLSSIALKYNKKKIWGNLEANVKFETWFYTH